MWLTKQQFLDLAAEARTAYAAKAALETQLKVLETNLDWFRVRVTQLEKERAQLMYVVNGVKIPTPEFIKQSEEPFDLRATLGELPAFADVGDEMAALMGLDHNTDGTVKYGTSKIPASE